MTGEYSDDGSHNRLSKDRLCLQPESAGEGKSFVPHESLTFISELLRSGNGDEIGPVLSGRHVLDSGLLAGIADTRPAPKC